MDQTITHHDIDETCKPVFLNRGYKGRHFFPHRILYVRRCGPDGFQVARQLLNLQKPCRLWEVVLYATGPVLDEFPDDLFFDDDVMWHQRQLGLRGQVASANMAVDGVRLYTFNHLSDLVQRISRRREHKTRVENRFKGWHFMLLNGILNFAVKRELSEIYIPTAELVMQSVDPARRDQVQPDLFVRLYDQNVNTLFTTRQEGLWWVVDVMANRQRLVLPDKRSSRLAQARKTICLFHDLERGIGHEGIDAELADYANRHGDRLLHQMLAIEEKMQLQTTYNVVGTIFADVQQPIREGNHCLAFHSYDHSIEPPKPDLAAPVGRLSVLPSSLRVFLRGAKHYLSNGGWDHYPSQLDQCRTIDYRIKGYRPPQSVLTSELTDENLCYYNFEWFANLYHSFEAKLPYLKNRLVKIPILYDDYPLYKRHMPYETWEERVLKLVREHDFVAIGLHDCYARYWLPQYQRLIDKLTVLGVPKTFDEVANEVFLANTW